MELSDYKADVLTLAAALRRRRWRLASAESCTGGLIAAACTAVAGSSDWFECGWVSYSNAAKAAMLGVPALLIAQHGAVSEEVALAMARGAASRCGADLAVAVTGIAGPGGSTPGKPVGTVWLAWAWRDSDGGATLLTQALRLQLAGDRDAVRHQTVARALRELCAIAA